MELGEGRPDHCRCDDRVDLPRDGALQGHPGPPVDPDRRADRLRGRDSSGSGRLFDREQGRLDRLPRVPGSELCPLDPRPVPAGRVHPGRGERRPREVCVRDDG